MNFWNMLLKEQKNFVEYYDRANDMRIHKDEYIKLRDNAQ